MLPQDVPSSPSIPAGGTVAQRAVACGSVGRATQGVSQWRGTAFWHVAVSSHTCCPYPPTTSLFFFFFFSLLSFRLAFFWMASPCRLVVIYLAAVSWPFCCHPALFIWTYGTALVAVFRKTGEKLCELTLCSFPGINWDEACTNNVLKHVCAGPFFFFLTLLHCPHAHTCLSPIVDEKSMHVSRKMQFLLLKRKMYKAPQLSQ